MTSINYKFERQSKSFLDWMHDKVKSERYFEAEAIDEPLNIKN